MTSEQLKALKAKIEEKKLEQTAEDLLKEAEKYGIDTAQFSLVDDNDEKVIQEPKIDEKTVQEPKIDEKTVQEPKIDEKNVKIDVKNDKALEILGKVIGKTINAEITPEQAQQIIDLFP